MALHFSLAVRNARLDAIETAIGTSPIIHIRSGSMPSSLADDASGALLVVIQLPSDWLAAASSGQKAKSGTWSATAGENGTAGYFRLYGSDGTACYCQGTVTASGGGGDLIIGSTTITSGGTVSVSSFTMTEGNP